MKTSRVRKDKPNAYVRHLLGIEQLELRRVLAAIRPGFDEFTLDRNDDASTELINLGFEVNFFGEMRDGLYVNNNGNVTFDQPLEDWTPDPIAELDREIIAPFWADVDTRNHDSGVVTYGYGQIDERNAFGVNWIDVGYFSENVDLKNSFQLLLTDRSDVEVGGFDIEFNYDLIEWETGDDSGQGGLGGDSARAGFSNGRRSAETSYELFGSGENGAFLNENLPTGLVNNSLRTSTPGRYVFEVRNGTALDEFGLTGQALEIGDGVFFLGAGYDPLVFRPETTTNREAADTINVPQIRAGGTLGLNLDGRGITAGIWEAGGNNAYVRATHQEFRGRVAVINDNGVNPNNPSNHATGVAGTLGAAGVNVAAQGMAPLVAIQSFNSANDDTELVTNAPAIEVSNHSYGSFAGWSNRRRINPLNIAGGALVRQSWSGDYSTSTVEDEEFGKYDNDSRLIDQALHNPAAQHLLSVWAAGNDQGDEIAAGAITGATNANPVVITSINHGLVTGDTVVITGVLGNAAANGTHVVTVVNGNSFSIARAGNGNYTGGGNFRTANYITRFSLGFGTGPAGWYLVPNAGATAAPGRDGGAAGFDTIPAGGNTAKNTLTVGASNELLADPLTAVDVTSLTLAQFTSLGPTDDGRIKPDVVANGTRIFTPEAANDADYTPGIGTQGTSFAAPGVAGLAVLLNEHFQDIRGVRPRSATQKALLIHTAGDVGNIGPDYRAGWGLVNGETAASFLSNENSPVPGETHLLEEATLNPNTIFSRTFTVSAGEPLKATIAWTDPAAAADLPGVDVGTSRLVNDLDIQIVGPGGTFLPWTLNAANPASPAVRTARNSVDNVEQVVIDAPQSGTYTIRISHTGALQGGNPQPFSLLASGRLVSPDAFEPNDTVNLATVLGSEPAVTIRDLTIHDGDVDYFRYTAHSTGKLIANTIFEHSAGDLELEIRDANDHVVASRFSTTNNETITIPVVSQEEYFVRVFSDVDAVNEYSLEIENFAAPAPRLPDLLADSDSGMMNDDEVTADNTPEFRVQTDLSDFALEGINVLNAVTANAASTPGVAVEVTVTNLTTGVSTTAFADPVGGSTLLFELTSLTLPDGEYFLSAATRVFDGRRNAADTTNDPATDRSQLSPPLIFVIDTVAPVAPLPELLKSSDSGISDSDNITNVQALAIFADDVEPNAKVRVFADGILVGKGTSTTQGVYEITTEPLIDGQHQITTEVEDAAGNVSDRSNAFTLEVDTLSPNLPFLDLVEADDSGRHNDDNITNVTEPDFTATTHDPNEAQHLFADNLIYRIYRRDEGGTETELFSSGLIAPSGVPVAAAGLALTANQVNSLKLEVEDRAGNISPDFLLSVVVDATAPDPPSIALDPAVTDTGISTDPATLSDEITRHATPGFFGSAEANALIRLFADATVSEGVINGSDQPIGMSLALPLDGDDALSGGQYRATSTRNLNDGFVRDGLRQIGVTAEDLAGNVSAPSFLDILLDTSPPRIERVDFADGSTVFAFKPELTPSPATNSILVTFTGGPSAAAGLSSPAVDLAMAANSRNYQLVGDHGGNVLINNAVIVSQSPERVVVALELSEFLPDDRFTFAIDESISDVAGNLLDGDSSAQSPGTLSILLPSGNGIPGGDFFSRFTIDSRPELGVVSQGLFYVDINGNHVFDPEGQDNDATNRDFVMQFGRLTDAHFAGNFADQATGVASGFDKLGSYGQFNGTYGFLLDTDDDGVGDFTSLMPPQFQVNGIPVAGNFSAANDGDEIGLFDGQAWYLDNNGNNRLDNDERIPATYNGIPVVGDFNGDGNDDLAVYVNDTNQFIFDTDRNGTADFIWNAIDDAGRFAGLSGFNDRPIAGDVNLDGIDDIGIWGPGRQGVLPEKSGEFFFWLSDRESANPAEVFDAYSPAPLGNDTFATFGDATALPIFGNFDPPVSGTLTNPINATDVNADGLLAPLDALLVINALNDGVGDYSVAELAQFVASTGIYLDVDGNQQLTPLDALLVINQLNAEGSSARNGDEVARPATLLLADRVDLALSDDEEDEERRFADFATLLDLVWD